MQVSQVNDHCTHAVIGGMDTIQFGISDSPEFFNILSSTLYKDQILAVARETLCNAWDAHIEAGVTHIPVQITLTEDRFTIRDFGTGIHRDDMGPIYGTYGNSTKKNDGKQTGGFGLGCKAPFAYTDHFEVISSHDGVRTIYNLSKSSAQAMGKPGIVPIASFPTTETGLQVSIHIANAGDQRKFLNLVKRIARNGDMNMTLNAEPIERLGFDPMVSNYFITSQNTVINNQTEIMVRYGNVVYPVDHVDGIHADYLRICNHIRQMSGRSNYCIVFQAPPHSISVTPSRESLSMQEHTLKTLKALFHGFLNMLDNPISGFRKRCDVFAEETVRQAVQQVKVSDLLSSEAKLPSLLRGEAPAQMFDMESMACRYMEVNYPSDLAFRKKDVTWRLQGMSDAKLLDRGLVQTYLRAMTKLADSPYAKQHDWLQRQVIAPLLVRMANAKLDLTRLYGLDRNDRNVPLSYHRLGGTPLIPARSISPKSVFHALPYLRNVIVLSTSSKDIMGRASQRGEFNKLGRQNGFLFYHVSMKKLEREKAIAFFQQSGMVVIDLNVKTATEIWEAEEKVTKAVLRKPTKKGVVSMLSVKAVIGDKSLNTTFSRKDDAARIEKPEFVVQVSLRNEVSKTCFDGWDSKASQTIVALFGTKGGITFNSAVHDKWIAQGAKEMLDYVVEKVAAEMASNPRIQEYWAFDVDRAIEDSHLYPRHDNYLVKVAYATPVLRKEFGLVNNLTDTDKQYLYLWTHLTADTRRACAVAAKVQLQLNAIPLDPTNKALLTRFQDNPVLDLIDGYRMSYLLNSSTTKPQHITNTIQLLLAALKK